MDFAPYALLAVAAYLIGSIPTGAIVARAYRNVDITQVGSQRTGATNTARTLGTGAGVIVLVGDFAKGALVAWIAHQTVPGAIALAGFFAVVGHIWSVFLRGRGGRGVMTGLGALAVMAPGVFALSCLVGSLVVVTTRYVSLGSICGAAAALVFGLGAYALGELPLEVLPYTLLVPALIFIAHGDNIQRLRAGTERRWGKSEPRPSPSEAR